MKIIVAGCRYFNDYEYIKNILDTENNITEIICGCAKGVDSLGERYAKENSIPIKYFYPDWDVYGRAAGPIRNKQMAEYGDKLIAFWDNKSKGTKNMITTMNNLNKPYKIFYIN